jgi:hypothetical protein
MRTRSSVSGRVLPRGRGRREIGRRVEERGWYAGKLGASGAVLLQLLEWKRR